MNHPFRFTALTDVNFFKEVLEHPEPVLVVFTKESSGSLQMITPVLDHVLPEYSGQIKIGCMDIERSKETASQYRIREIPTLLFFKDGVVVDYMVGLFRGREFKTRLETLLGGNP